MITLNNSNDKQITQHLINPYINNSLESSLVVNKEFSTAARWPSFSGSERIMST